MGYLTDSQVSDEFKGGALRHLKLCALAAAVVLAAPASARANGLAVNRALGGSVQPGSAAKLIDGSASTLWCPTEAGSSAGGDLGRAAPPSGAGDTMGTAASAGRGGGSGHGRRRG